MKRPQRPKNFTTAIICGTVLLGLAIVTNKDILIQISSKYFGEVYVKINNIDVAGLPDQQQVNSASIKPTGARPHSDPEQQILENVQKRNYSPSAAL